MFVSISCSREFLIPFLFRTSACPSRRCFMCLAACAVDLSLSTSHLVNQSKTLHVPGKAILTSANGNCYNQRGGGNSSTGRAPDCGSDGCGFDSRFPPQIFPARGASVDADFFITHLMRAEMLLESAGCGQRRSKLPLYGGCLLFAGPSVLPILGKRPGLNIFFSALFVDPRIYPRLQFPRLLRCAVTHRLADRDEG